MGRAIEIRRFDAPDQRLDMAGKGGIAIVALADGTKGMHAVFEPGWTWEKDEKPLLGSPDSCPMPHKGYCFAGTLVVRMIDSGAQSRISAGDFFDIPPRHDGYVEGAERVEMILFEAPHRD
jgi:hypothetical protein